MLLDVLYEDTSDLGYNKYIAENGVKTYEELYQEQLKEYYANKPVLYYCERCGRPVYESIGKYDQGRFCSRNCANSRIHSEETKNKISESLNNYFKSIGIEKTKREIHREQRKKEIEDEKIKINNEINKLLESGEYKYLEYKGIDFGDNYIINKDGNIISTKTLKNISTSISRRSNYKQIVISDKNKNQHCLYIHRIIAINYIQNPNNYPIINHKDENTLNNDINNLEWCTYQYNNTYNGINIKNGLKLRGMIPWNKGKKLKEIKK